MAKPTFAARCGTVAGLSAPLSRNRAKSGITRKRALESNLRVDIVRVRDDDGGLPYTLETDVFAPEPVAMPAVDFDADRNFAHHDVGQRQSRFVLANRQRGHALAARKDQRPTLPRQHRGTRPSRHRTALRPDAGARVIQARGDHALRNRACSSGDRMPSTGSCLTRRMKRCAARTTPLNISLSAAG
jgi:hypothetical protein